MEELPDALGALPDSIGAAVDAALRLEGAVATARALCPADTGALAGSIRAEKTGEYEASLVAGGSGYTNPRTGRSVGYAEAVHDGAGRTPARPFLEQALIIESDAVGREMLEGVEP
jgi:hypothetical protein